MERKPACAPDVIPPRKPQPPEPGSDSEGSNAVQHEPNPKADHQTPQERARAPRGPYTTGND